MVLTKQLMHGRAALYLLSLESIRHTSVYRTYVLGGLRLEESLVEAALPSSYRVPFTEAGSRLAAELLCV